MLTLVHRTNCRGGELRGRVSLASRREWHPSLPPCLTSRPHFVFQAGIYRECNDNPTISGETVDRDESTGCCSLMGIRVVYVDEGHFSRHHNGDWRLYVQTRRRHTEHQIRHAYILIPSYIEPACSRTSSLFGCATELAPAFQSHHVKQRNRATEVDCSEVKPAIPRGRPIFGGISQNHQQKQLMEFAPTLRELCDGLRDWSYMGTCRSCALRLDMEHYLQPVLRQRQLMRRRESSGTGSTAFHIHIVAFMDYLHDC
jgi:hypothetical protein